MTDRQIHCIYLHALRRQGGETSSGPATAGDIPQGANLSIGGVEVDEASALRQLAMMGLIPHAEVERVLAQKKAHDEAQAQKTQKGG